MRHRKVTVLSSTATLLALVAVPWPTSSRAPVRAAELSLSAPLTFEANHGQADAEIRFLAWSDGLHIALRANDAVVTLPGPQGAPRSEVNVTFGGGSRNPIVTGLDLQQARSHYFSGNDPRQWQPDVPHYGRVRYAGIYPGIDVVFRADGRQLAYDFIVAPGADPRVIDVQFGGVAATHVADNGDIVLRTQAGEVRQRPPVIYQDTAGGRNKIAGAYVRRGQSRVGIGVSTYDAKLPLVIDPTLVSSTYLGDVRYDAGRAIAVDATGHVYVAGGRQVADNTDADAFVAKFDPTGSVLLWRTMIGGVLPDEANGLALDAAGNVHITGWTSSSPSNPPGRPEFPTTPAAMQRAYGGGSTDAFVAVLSPSGSLVYSSFLGGDGEDAGADIALDATGTATLAGWTRSTDFPLMQPVQAALAGGSDAYVARLNADKSALVYSTYLGGGGDDRSARLALDGSGHTHVAGVTSSTDFPTLRPLQATYAGGEGDAFAAALEPGGAFLTYSTYLGGSGRDEALDIAADGTGHSYITGTTDSPDFPTTGALQNALASPPLTDAFVTKLAPQGSALIYSTYLGSRGGHSLAVDAAGDVFLTGDGILAAKLHRSGTRFLYTVWGIGGSALALGANGDAYVTGKTLSNLLPTRNAAQPRNGGMFSSRGREDAFVTRIAARDAERPAVEEDAPAISYTGTWTESMSSAHSGGRALRSTEPGARATFTFNGTGVQLVGYRDGSSGAMIVTLDGGLTWGNVDTYSSPAEPQPLILSITGLAAGPHTITLEVASFKNARSQGHGVWIDGFTVLGGPPLPRPTPTPSPTPTPTPRPTPTPTAAPTLRIEENNRAQVRYHGEWYRNVSTIHSGRRAALAMNAGATATLTFTGTGVRWIGYRDEWSGRARVFVDGTPVRTVDTYASPAQRQPVVFAASGLAPGLHTLTIEVLGNQNQASGGSWVWVDAFDVVVP